MGSPSDILYVSCYKTLSDYLYQACYMPIELMKILNLNFESIAYLEIGGKGLICQVLPTFSSCCHPYYNILASYEVMHNVTHLNDFHFEECSEISMDNVSLLTVKDILEINISIVMVNVDGVIKAKKKPVNFKKSIKSLLQLYKVMGNSIVNCIKNPLAAFLGISYLIINNITLSNDKAKSKFIGRTTFETEITILNIESEERHYSLVKNYSLLGGLDPILTELKSIVFSRWNKSANLNSCSGGVLLVGPPGCGKSSLVQQLCYETKASYICTAGAELQSPFEGETLQNFEKIIRKSCSLSREGPCILFIDEIDSVGFPKINESNRDDSHLTNQALSLLDDCKEYDFLFVMAATNRPYALDQSFGETGRLSQEILLSVPTLNQRKEILDIYCKGLLPDSHSVLVDIAVATPGFVGADLKFICEKARENLLPKETSFTNINPSVVYEEMMRLLKNFSPSIHKSLEFFTEKPKFSPIGGLDHIKTKLNLILSVYSKFNIKCKRSSLKKPRGILFYGPRGCGKTQLVSHLASQKGFSFIAANAPHLLSCYVGESEKRVAALFHSARLAQPSIVFIDEIDGIFGSRESSSKGVKVNLITELLQAMDGGLVGNTSRQGSNNMDNSHGENRDDILVCAATNYPEKLDSALIRQGRFDHLIYVPPPDEEGRFEILKLKSHSLKIDEKILRELAARSEGWTGSELGNLITAAVYKSFLSGHVPKDTEEIYISEEIMREEFNSLTSSLAPKDLKRYEQFAEK